VTLLATQTDPKRLELLHELIPTATKLAVLENPTNPSARAKITELQTAAQRMGLRLFVASASGKAELHTAFANGPAVGATDETLLSDLAARGFVDGQNLVVVRRAAEAHPERLDGLVAELKRLMWMSSSHSAIPPRSPPKRRPKTYRSSSPARGDPVATGLVDGLARPGGNITGVTELGTELAKRLEILRDALPALARVAMLWNAADLGMTMTLPEQ
jgi:ABC transporter substrate binding protein